MAETETQGSTQGEPGAVGSPAFVQWLSARVTAYSLNPWDDATVSDIRHARALLTRFLLSAEEETLPQLFSNELAKLHLSMASSGLRDLPLNNEEQSSLEKVLSAFTADASKGTPAGHILAAMLYCRPDHATADFLDRQVPEWLHGVLTAFMVIEPYFFEEDTAFKRYCAFAHRVVHATRDTVSRGKNDACGLMPKARAAAYTYARFSCPIYPYFAEGDLRSFSEDRAYILEQNARASGLQLDHVIPERQKDRKKIRIGILKPHFSSQTETFATLPIFEHLDRKKFEIRLYVLEAAHNSLERYCASRADRMSMLPKNPHEQAAALRAEQLDILFFGSNLTAGVDACTTLAMHRIAPVQVASICCPVSTGFSHMDYYIAGNLLASNQTMQSQFREQLVNVDGSGICFSFGPEHFGATQSKDRGKLGVPDDAIMFISGANYFKIIPEVRDVWAKIVSKVPNAVLVLYPFNPNWSSRYNAKPFVDDMKMRFAQYGLDENQLKILDPLPTRADIKALLKLADVYLDSFPYGGATSLIDTLEAGPPPVVIEGDTLRFRQASSMLRELSMPQLITNSVSSYIDLACALGTDSDLRQQLRKNIQSNMRKRPPFLDSRNYAKKIAQAFETLHTRTATQ